MQRVRQLFSKQVQSIEPYETPITQHIGVTSKLKNKFNREELCELLMEAVVNNSIEYSIHYFDERGLYLDIKLPS